MKKFFYIGGVIFILFELGNVFFIMPFPGSQEMESINIAYFFFEWRWNFRLLAVLLMLVGLKEICQHSRILTLIILVVLGVIIYMTNCRMRADKMFHDPKHLIMSKAADNKVPGDKLIIGVEKNGEAVAFPINYLAFHHKVNDTIGGKPIMATYCSVCRTGRVYEPVVNGNREIFRLVGMDHYNAMFEDKTTKSWWRQVTGEAIAGKLKGQQLPEFPSLQTSLNQWLSMYPNSLVLQPDPEFREEFDSLADFESGLRKGRLERRDTTPWLEKSWIVGIEVDNEAKAYDWNELLSKRIINDEISSVPIVIFIADDQKSFFAYRRFYPDQKFSIRNDTLSDEALTFNLLGHPYQDQAKSLTPVQVYQEYWHSWRTFHPNTLREN